MAEAVYQQLCNVLAKRGGLYPGRDIPEFFALVEELFTPEEAEIYVAIPRGFHPAADIARNAGKDGDSAAAILETMADKGLCNAGKMGGVSYYSAPMFVPGIFEYQFMRGTRTDRDRTLARLIHDYKRALDAGRETPRETYPLTRVIPVDRTVAAGNTVHTYHQVATYIEKYSPISVSTCFCRHEARLLDENDHCGAPDDVCMQFGMGAQFVIDRNMGRKVSREEAMAVLDKAEDAGLVHTAINRQEIDFVCNCCACHCMILKKTLAHPRPGVVLNSGFQPRHDKDLCIACGVCIDRCPTEALAMGEDEVPTVDLDRCIGCGVCATGCEVEAVTLVERPGVIPPPVDQAALRAAMKASHAQ
ncbi:MAG: 4Fe-4S binding protein [Desulfobacterales bacterium]|nr:4Fe-4S binding protein [Desulfobacterales bacterium]